MTDPVPKRLFNARPGCGKRTAMFAAQCYAATLGGPSTPHLSPGPEAYRLLVQSVGGIGNTLMATPLLGALRAMYPNARIDLLTTDGAAQLLSANADVSTIVTDDTAAVGPQSIRTFANALRYRRLVRAVRRERYDAALLAHNAIDLMSAARPALARIPIRAIHGYRFRPADDFTFLFTHIAPYRSAQHDCRGNLDLAQVVAGEPVADRPMSLTVPEANRADAVAALRALGWPDSGVTIGVCPGSRAWATDKRWPTDRYARVVQQLLDADSGRFVLAFCGPDDEREAAILRDAVRHDRFRVVDALGLLSYAAALQQCRVVISNDSLPMHICSALQIPVVALFGPTDPQRVGPWKVRARVLSAKTDYTPYFAMPYICDLAAGDPCIETIDECEVISAAEELLQSMDG